MPTLREIDAGLVDAIERAENATTENELAAAQTDISLWVEAELVKVDRIRDYLRHCQIMEAAAKEEAQVQIIRAGQWKDRTTRLKTFVALVMEQRGVKRLEGNTGTLAIKGNGGRAPVEINNEALVPDEFCDIQCSFEGAWPAKALAALVNGKRHLEWKRVPNKALIGECLSMNLPVPGCNLGPRGEHLEVK